MLIHKSTTYVDIVSHFAFVVCFWQIQRLDVFWHAWRFAIHKWICIKFTPYLQILVDACLQASSHGYWTTIMHQLTHHCLFVIFWLITTMYSPDLAPCDFFLFPKLKWAMKGWRFPTIEEIVGRAQDYTKKCLSEELRGLEKALAQVLYIWGGLLWRGNIVIDV